MAIDSENDVWMGPTRPLQGQPADAMPGKPGDGVRWIRRSCSSIRKRAVHGVP